MLLLLDNYIVWWNMYPLAWIVYIFGEKHCSMFHATKEFVFCILWSVSVSHVLSILRYQQFLGQFQLNFTGMLPRWFSTKLAKFVPWPPSWKSFLNCFWTEKPVNLKLGWKLYWVTCWSKIAKIIPIRNPRWPPSWKSILSFFSWTEKLFDSKLGRKYCGVDQK